MCARAGAQARRLAASAGTVTLRERRRRPFASGFGPDDESPRSYRTNVVERLLMGIITAEKYRPSTPAYASGLPSAHRLDFPFGNRRTVDLQ